MLFNFVILKHESKAYSSELVDKAKYVFNKIRTSGINMIQVKNKKTKTRQNETNKQTKKKKKKKKKYYK